jgi:phospholipid/cholesterol/gamma-HCH transport system substrate-binding protein
MNVSQYVKVALFFIVLGIAGGAYVIMSSDGLNTFNTKLYEVTIPDATGLSTRSKIYLAGVPVGKIQSINLEGNKAHLKVAFLKDVEIREDARIARKASSILGTSILTLDPGTELTPILSEGGRVNAEQDTGNIDAVIKLVQEMGGQISEILTEFQNNQMKLLAVSLETFNSLARKIDSQTDAELDRISRILEAVAGITERTDRILANREDDINGSVLDIRSALENIRHITGEIRQGHGNFGQAVYDDKLYGTLLSTVGKTEEAAVKLQTALDSINTLAINVNGVVSSAGEIVDRANGLGISVDTHAGYGLLSGTTRAGASLRLDPRSNDRWYRIGVSTGPDGVSSRTVTTTTDQNGVVTSKDKTETRYTVTVDAELARRFGIVTLRGGLLESTAGLGFDIQPIRWVSLSGEVFNFKTGAAPNLRGSITVFPFFNPNSDKPWNWLYLRGGVRNAINQKRDYFLGGGIRFTDREVKGLVGLLPVFGGR